MNASASKLIDTSSLTYGSVIPPTSVVAFTGVPQSKREYGLRVMELADMVESALFLRDGKEYDVVIRKDSVVVLTPQEALENNANRRRVKALRMLKKALRKLGHIPVGGLTDEEQKELKEAQLHIGRVVDFATKDRRAIPEVEKTHERLTPATL